MKVDKSKKGQLMTLANFTFGKFCLCIGAHNDHI